MKLRTLAPLSVLFLLLGVSIAFAAPADMATAGDDQSAVLAAPASEVATAANCEAPSSPFATTVFAANSVNAGFTYNCGSCSQDPCKGAAVWSICGYANGQYKRCQDYLGTTCSADGNARCRCSSDDLP